MMEDKYIIYWYAQHIREWVVEFPESEAAAMTLLAEWAHHYPMNTYTLAKVIGVQNATKERQATRAPTIAFTGGGSGATCSVAIKDGAITSIITGP